MRIKQEFLNMLNRLFADPGTGRALLPMVEAWDAVRKLDEERRGNKDLELSDLVDLLRDSVQDKTHPLNRDAVLLSAILTRPLGEDAPSLEDFLVQTVYPKFELGMAYDCEQWAHATLRDIKRHVAPIATEAQFYSAAGRALLLKSLLHMTGNSTDGSAAAVKPMDKLDLYDRGDVLQFAISAFPKTSEGNDGVIMFHDFYIDDPLEKRGFHYEA